MGKTKLAVRKIVLLAYAQKNLSNDEKTFIARKASLHATDEAIATGCRDYLEAHQPQAVRAFDALLADENATALDKATVMLVISNKRCCNNQSQHGRDVR